MLILVILALSSFTRGHETYESEIIPLRPPELIPGLEKYSITHHLDFPLPITSDFFFEQIIDKSSQNYIQENIFSTEQGVPNWLFLFTVDNSERFNCNKCGKLLANFKDLAEHLQLEQPQANYKVGTVMCNTLEAARLCDYFHLEGVPHIMVLRPDLNKFFKFWKFAQDSSQDGILDFALKSYPYAFTQRGLPFGGDKNALPFFEGFKAFTFQFFQDIMEENYIIMKGFGLVDEPVGGYRILYFMTCAAMMTPAILLVYFYLIYKFYKHFTRDFTKKDCDCPHDFNNDPDFEPATAFEEEKENSKKNN